MAAPENNVTPSSEIQWGSGAEQATICTSCSTAFPPEATECPKCHVSLSLVRRCPDCKRIQSAHHSTCIYCSSSIVPEGPRGATVYRPLGPPREAPWRRVHRALVVLVGLVAVVTPVVYIRQKRASPKKPEEPIGQSYVLSRTSLRQAPSNDAPQIKDLQPPEVVDILAEAVDSVGNWWFRISSKGTRGYVRMRDLAPPKGTDPEKTFNLLRHSLLELDDPSILPEASAAAEYYRKAFPASSHVDEVMWLLAERTRQLAEHSERRQALLSSAKEQYEQIAQGSSEFAERARQVITRLSAGQRTVPSQQRVTPSTLEFSVVGGSLTSSHPSRAGSPNTPVRRLTVLSQTPILVRLTEPVQASPGVTFQGVIDEPILVNHELAIPRGSLSLLTIMEGAATPAARSAPPITLRLTAVVVDHRTYGTSAEAVRVEPPVEPSQGAPPDQPSPQLLAGTRVLFRLNAPIVVMHP